MTSGKSLRFLHFCLMFGATLRSEAPKMDKSHKVGEVHLWDSPKQEPPFYEDLTYKMGGHWVPDFN